MYKELYEALEAVTLFKRTRRNVGAEPYRYAVFLKGVYPRSNRNRGLPARANTHFPTVWKLLQSAAGDFEYTSVIVNKNKQMNPHRDGKNAGESLIFAVGDYTGGELVIEGKKYDIKNNPMRFDGRRQTHWVAPFKGTRYSVVYFKYKRNEK